MSRDEIQQKLHCRRCGRPRTVNRVSKPSSNKVKLYMSCPVHTSQVTYSMALSQYDEVSDLVREHVLLCKKCGQPVDIVGQRAGNLTTKLNIQCPEHGSGERQVNNSLLDPILSAVSASATSRATPTAPTTMAKFCPSCGSPVPTAEARFCHHCGASLE
ncbi:MAG: zinc-ribbon domain-containing protein [Promethearchaeota archaeon]